MLLCKTRESHCVLCRLELQMWANDQTQILKVSTLGLVVHAHLGNYRAGQSARCSVGSSPPSVWTAWTRSDKCPLFFTSPLLSSASASSHWGTVGQGLSSTPQSLCVAQGLRDRGGGDGGGWGGEGGHIPPLASRNVWSCLCKVSRGAAWHDLDDASGVASDLLLLSQALCGAV